MTEGAPTEELLTEIRDLLQVQNSHLEEIKKMNAEVAARSLLMFDRSQEVSRQTQALVGSAASGTAKYFIALLVFMLILLSLSSSHFRSLWRMLGL